MIIKEKGFIVSISNRHRKILLIILLSVGITLSVLFLPFIIEDSYCCIYHYIFDYNQPALSGNSIPANNSIQNNSTSLCHGQSNLLDRYLSNYVLLWWLGITIMGISVYLLKPGFLLHMFIPHKNSEGK